MDTKLLSPGGIQGQAALPAPASFVDERCWWRFAHALAFCAGGLLFTAGTSLYFPAMHDAALAAAAAASGSAADGDGSAAGSAAAAAYSADIGRLGDLTAWLYIIGSAGFLFVDVQEFFTFVGEPACRLRLNIACSMLGSTLYVIGSAGFLPPVYAATPLVGILGFIAGSAAIGMSQAWKLCRILTTSANDAAFHSRVTLGCDRATAAFVEGGERGHYAILHFLLQAQIV